MKNEVQTGEVIEVAAEWREQGRDVALATVVATWGSAPVPVGSQLVVDKTGNFAGSVSGGCIEGAVIDEALKLLGGGAPQMLKFGVTDQRAWEAGLSCGGEIEIYLERIE